jgi:rRNA maturation protein Nop10
MKTCSECGKRIYRETPDDDEYGIAVVDGRQYPEVCPNCGAPVE